MPFDETYVRQELERIIPHWVVDGDCWYSCPNSGEACNYELVCNCPAERQREDVLSLIRQICPTWDGEKSA